MPQARITDERLFDTDAYLYTFDATVTGVRPVAGGACITLDRTAFFPQGGGQGSDVGTLKGYAVTDVREGEVGIEHFVTADASAFSVGDAVHAEVDAEVRFSAMQCHTAEHILSGLIYTLYGYDNVGFHLGREDMTLDTSGVLSEEQLDRIELLANRAVYANGEVTVSYPTAEELASLTYRSKIPLSGRVRIVTVSDVDCCACCAPHVKRTGEIGLIKITGAEKHRGGMRLYVQAGERALRYMQEEHRELHRASAMLSAHPSELSAAVGRMKDELKDVTLLYKGALADRMRSYARTFCAEDENPVEVFPSLDADTVRVFMNAAVPRVRGVLVALMPKTGGGFDFLLATERCDLTAKIGDIREHLLARGGGSTRMMQGSLRASEEDVRAYFAAHSFIL